MACLDIDSMFAMLFIINMAPIIARQPIDDSLFDKVLCERFQLQSPNAVIGSLGIKSASIMV